MPARCRGYRNTLVHQAQGARELDVTDEEAESDVLARSYLPASGGGGIRTLGGP